MSITPTPAIDYTSSDFDSLRTRCYNLVAQVFPTWTAQDVANFGNILVELFCHVGDTLGFYLDNAARESRWTQARLRSTVVALVKMIGYVPIGATAATTDETFTLSAIPAGDVVFPVGTLVRTQNVASPVTFQTTAEATILAGANPPTVTVEVEHSQSFAATYASTGLANQEIRLANTPYLDPTAAVTAGNGAYTRVTTFLSSGPADRHYTVVVDNSDRATIRFGNGSNGVLPSGTIDITYKTGGGPEGNVESGTIRRIDGTFTDTLSNTVTVSVTNAALASGGAARQSRAQIQAAAPASLTTLTRTVSRADYETNARRVPGVARALMLTSNQLASVSENSGRLYVVPAGGGTAGTGLRDDVYTMVTETYPNTLTFRVDVFSAEYLPLNIVVSVYPRAGVNKTALAALIRANLVAFFALTTGSGDDVTDNPNVDFGFNASQTSDGTFDGKIAFSDIYNVVRDTTGVRKIHDGINGFLINGSANDVSVAAYQFPTLGSVSVLNAESGTALVS